MFPPPYSRAPQQQNGHRYRFSVVTELNRTTQLGSRTIALVPLRRFSPSLTPLAIAQTNDWFQLLCILSCEMGLSASPSSPTKLPFPESLLWTQGLSYCFSGLEALLEWHKATWWFLPLYNHLCPPAYVPSKNKILRRCAYS